MAAPRISLSCSDGYPKVKGTSVLSRVKCRIEALELCAGVLGGELPIHLGLNGDFYFGTFGEYYCGTDKESALKEDRGAERAAPRPTASTAGTTGRFRQQESCGTDTEPLNR